jgi:hypothetical protein
MSRASHRIFGAIIGLVVAFAIGYLTITIGNVLAGHDSTMPSGSLFQTSGYDQSAHSFYAVHTLALIIAAGLTAALIASGTLRRAGPLWLSLLLLAILAPLSWLNYGRPDLVLPDATQASLDLGMVVLGIICAYCIIRSSDGTANVRLILATVLGLIVFGAILLPGSFIILWLCWVSGLATESYFFAVVWTWIMEFAIVVAIAVAGFYYASRTRSSEINRSDPTSRNFNVL